MELYAIESPILKDFKSKNNSTKLLDYNKIGEVQG